MAELLGLSQWYFHRENSQRSLCIAWQGSLACQSDPNGNVFRYFIDSHTYFDLRTLKSRGIAASSTMTQKAITAGMEWSYKIPMIALPRNHARP